MSKRRRLAQPALPTSQDNADTVVSSSRYAQLDGDEFYQALIDTGQDGTALAFASTKQLEMMQTATEVYFEVCLIGQRDGVALVPCGHARFCGACVDRLVSMDSGCPICRTDIQMVMRVYN